MIHLWEMAPGRPASGALGSDDDSRASKILDIPSGQFDRW
jgi:hypothetical protein